MKHNVFITFRAKQEFQTIANWIYSNSSKGANTWIDYWEESLDGISLNSYDSSFAPENEYHVLEIHQICFKTRKGNSYRILHIITPENIIYVTKVLAAC